VKRLCGHLFNGKAIVLLLQALLLTLLVPSGASARIERELSALEINAVLQKNGSLSVTQTLDFANTAELSWPLYSDALDLQVSADGRKLGAAALRRAKSGEVTLVSAPGQTGTKWQLSYRTNSLIIRSKERDQLYFQVLRESGFSVEYFTASFRLPEEASGGGLVGNLYGIGGIGSAVTTKVDEQELLFQAGNVGPRAILTMNAHWPKSVLKLGLFQELRLAFEDLEVAPWVGLAVLLPLLALAVLWRLIRRQRRYEAGTIAVRPEPPAALSPLIVGTLVDKKVYPKEIIALLIDVCQRGYVVIVKKSGQYYLSQRRQFDENLEGWERDILEALFPVANTKLTEQTMRALNRKSLFNPKVRRAFGSIYEAVTAKSFFAENPHTTRVRYKLFALSLYFLSVIGAVWIAVTGSSPYLLLPLAGTMLVCRLILKLTPTLVRYTPMGLQARKDWLAFRSYLSVRKPLPLEAARNRIFEKYLAYAVALGVTVDWAKRFDLSEIVILKPDWFVSYEESSTAQFAQDIEDFSRSISELLTEMRGPLVN
jgi:hypothetical protein